MPLTPTQTAQQALNIADAVQTQLANNQVSQATALHDLAASIKLLAQAALGGGPTSTNIGSTYGTSVSSSAPVSTKTR